MTALQQYYQAYINPRNIATEFNFPSEHCIPTLSYGEACTVLSSPYIGDCNNDGAGSVLKQLYGELVPGEAVAANLKQFDQTMYYSGATSASIGSTGYIYTPTACTNLQPCRLHVAYHGCLQTLADIGNEFAVHAGYNSWAEANRIVVLYPYATANSRVGNPNGCWDWWGYTGPAYAYKTGVQMEFSKKLIDSIAAKI